MPRSTIPLKISLPGVCLLALLCGGALSGCGTSGATPRGNALRLPLYGNLRTNVAALLDPARTTTSTPLSIAALLDSGLVKFGPDLHVIPELAVSIPTISSSGRTYTFTIRQDARFADGRRCAAADVAYSLTRALTPIAGAAPPARVSLLARRYLGGIVGAAAVESGRSPDLSGVQVLDRLTIRIRLAHPDANFLDKLAFPVAAVVERSSGPHPAGMGPWRITARSRDGSLVLEPRPHYYGDPVEIRQLRLVPVSDERRGLALYHRGAIDVATVPFDQYAQLMDRQDFHQSESLDAYYAVPPPGLGRQLAARLDRTRLAADDSPALSSLSGIVPPAVPDYVSSPPPAVAASAALPPVTLRISDPSDPGSAALRAALRRQWPAGRGAPSVWLLHATYVLPEPDRWLLTVLPRTRSPWFRRMLSQAQVLTNDPVSRMGLYSQAENWALQRGLLIPLASGNTAVLMRPSIQSLQVTPLGIMPQNNNWALVSVQ